MWALRCELRCACVITSAPLASLPAPWQSCDCKKLYQPHMRSLQLRAPQDATRQGHTEHVPPSESSHAPCAAGLSARSHRHTHPRARVHPPVQRRRGAQSRGLMLGWGARQGDAGGRPRRARQLPHRAARGLRDALRGAAEEPGRVRGGRQGPEPAAQHHGAPGSRPRTPDFESARTDTAHVLCTHASLRPTDCG